MRQIDADALCEDFKERQRAALRWKEKAILDGDEERQIRADATLAFLSEVKLTIDEAPTVERPHGEWVLNDTLFGSTSFRCSVCNDVTDDVPTCMNKSLYKYCPVCGAKMEADDDPN